MLPGIRYTKIFFLIALVILVESRCKMDWEKFSSALKIGAGSLESRDEDVAKEVQDLVMEAVVCDDFDVHLACSKSFSLGGHFV